MDGLAGAIGENLSVRCPVLRATSNMDTTNLNVILAFLEKIWL